MAADRMVCNGTCKIGERTKIFKINGHLAGFAGNHDTAAVLQNWVEHGAKEEEWPFDENDQAAVMLVTPDGRILVYERYPFPVLMENDFYAIGSGSPYALAAMHLGCSAEQAVKTACELDVFTGGEVDTLCLNEKTH